MLDDEVAGEEPTIAEEPAPALVASLTPSVITAPVTAVLESLPERDWNGTPAAYILAPTTDLGVREDLDRVSSPSVRATISAAVRQTVDVEGPIEVSRLARNIGVRFGFGRVTASRAEVITSVVPPELVHSSELGDFVWPAQLDPSTWRGYRSKPADHTRALPDIAPEEIVNAMMHACSRTLLAEVDLMRETLSAFGLKRLTASTEEHLRERLTFGVTSDVWGHKWPVDPRRRRLPARCLKRCADPAYGVRTVGPPTPSIPNALWLGGLCQLVRC